MKQLLMTGVALLALSSSAAAAPMLWAGNGHYYDLVTVPATWDEARAAAQASSHLGEQGYLATVTSAAEQAFIVASLPSVTAWLGATDRAVEGVWNWETGPEVGSVLTYTNWAPGEPNNCCSGEDELVMNWGALGSWNDIGTPAFPFNRYAYVVEYGGLDDVPEPATLLLGGIALGAVARRLRRRS